MITLGIAGGATSASYQGAVPTQVHAEETSEPVLQPNGDHAAVAPALALDTDGDQAARATITSRRAGALPEVARRAYVRAAQVMNDANRGCHLRWQLLAGAGWIESQHGTRNGALLSASGVPSPPFFGPVTSRIDSDAGQLDGTASMDRTMGPFQFSPHRWQIAGVDGDGDGFRDPQDVDDAALGYAVLLCAGSVDLRTREAVASSLLRINNDQAYPREIQKAATYYTRHPGAETEAGEPFEIVAIEEPAPPSHSPTNSAAPAPAPPSVEPKPSPPAPPKTSPKPTPTAKATPSSTPSPVAPAPTESTSPEQF